MIKVYVEKESNYPVSSPKLKEALKDFLKDQGIVSESDVNVSIVGKDRMLYLAKKYLNEKDVLHNVLSFPTTEVRGEFKEPPDKILHLGEIIICYPKIVEEVSSEGVLIEEKVIELVTHGALHLLGKHHK